VLAIDDPTEADDRKPGDGAYRGQEPKATREPDRERQGDHHKRPEVEDDVPAGISAAGGVPNHVHEMFAWAGPGGQQLYHVPEGPAAGAKQCSESKSAVEREYDHYHGESEGDLAGAVPFVRYPESRL
jgi:hypothetical protein